MIHLGRMIAALAAALLGVSVMSAISPTTAHARAVSAPSERVTVERDAQRAAGCRIPNCYAAVSLSPDQAYGYTYNRATRARAVRIAHRKCKANSNYPGQCTKMGSVGNGCMAVAIKTNSNGWITAWATGFGRSARAAKRQAIRRNDGGRIRVWTCTSRRY